MPCHVDPNDFPDPFKGVSTAVLCAVIRKYGLYEIAENIDWTECGVPRQLFYDWWEYHSRQDRQRKEQQLRDLAKYEIAREARSKLSESELKALGLK